MLPCVSSPCGQQHYVCLSWGATQSSQTQYCRTSHNAVGSRPSTSPVASLASSPYELISMARAGCFRLSDEALAGTLACLPKVRQCCPAASTLEFEPDAATHTRFQLQRFTIGHGKPTLVGDASVTALSNTCKVLASVYFSLPFDSSATLAARSWYGWISLMLGSRMLHSYSSQAIAPF